MSRFSQLALPLGAPIPIAPPQSVICKIATPMPRQTTRSWQFERPGFRVWLLRVWQHGYVHGSTLVDDMCEAAAGRFVIESAQADNVLTAAEKAGWILRGENAPTHSQATLAGLQYSRKTYHSWRNSDGVTPAQFHASHWYWSPNRDNVDALAFLGSELEAVG